MRLRAAEAAADRRCQGYGFAGDGELHATRPALCCAWERGEGGERGVSGGVVSASGRGLQVAVWGEV